MKKYPFVKQPGLKDCGPACLQMILKYYNGYVSLDKLSEMLCTNNNGTSAYHMVEVLKSLGFESSGYKYENVSSLKCPCIAFININSYNHYVVIYEINFKKKLLIIGDPAKGIIKMGFKEFLSYWSGIVIEMIPVRTVVSEAQIKVRDFIFKLIRPNIKYLFWISLLSLLVGISSIIISFFMQAVITYINDDILFYVFLFFVLLILFVILVSYIRNLILIKLNQKFDESLSLDTFSHIIHLPYYYCKNKTAGEVTSYFNDLFLIKDVISHVSVSLFIDIPLIIILIVFMFFIDYQLFIINMFILSLYSILYMAYKKKIYYLTDEVLRKKSLVNSNIVEAIKGYETVINLNVQSKVINNFERKYAEYLNVGEKTAKMKSREFLFRELIGSLSTVLIIIYGIISLKNGLPVSMFITVFLLSSLLNSSFKNILEFDYELEEVKSSINHVSELFLKHYQKENIKVDGNICVKNLSFSFDRVKNVLKDVNLDIKIGTKMMVAGASGCGKSTLFKIIRGYYDDYNGSVTTGGFESKNYNFENVLYVSGKEILFTGRVFDNLNLREFDLKNNEVCELSEFVSDYNMLVEEDGFNISDGQRQRIVLARALSNFNVLIIDEGLSQVDVNMERRILKKLFRRYQSKTIIFISHRLDNLDLFDRFLKLDNGKVVLDEMRSN